MKDHKAKGDEVIRTLAVRIDNVMTVANDFQASSKPNLWNPRDIDLKHVKKIADGLLKGGTGTHGAPGGVITLDPFDFQALKEFIESATIDGDGGNLTLDYFIGAGDKAKGRAILDVSPAAAFVGQHRVAASQQLQASQEDCPVELITFNHAHFIIHAQTPGTAGFLALQNNISFAGERENNVASTVLLVDFNQRFRSLNRIYTINFPNGKEGIKGFTKTWKELKLKFQHASDLSAGYVSSLAKLICKSPVLAGNIFTMITQITGPAGASYSPPTNCAPFNNIGNAWIDDKVVNTIVEAVLRCDILVKNFNSTVVMKIAHGICLAVAQEDLKISDKGVKKQLKGFTKDAGVTFVVRCVSSIFNKIKKLDDLQPALRQQITAAFTTVRDKNAGKKARKDQVCSALTLSSLTVSHSYLYAMLIFILIFSQCSHFQKANGDKNSFQFPNRTIITAHRGNNIPVMQNLSMKRNIGEHSTHTRTRFHCCSYSYSHAVG